MQHTHTHTHFSFFNAHLQPSDPSTEGLFSSPVEHPSQPRDAADEVSGLLTVETLHLMAEFGKQVASKQ